MVARKAKRPPRPKSEAPARNPRRTLALPVPSSIELIAAGIVLALLVAGAIALYAKGHADGYGNAQAHYLELMAEQAAANKAAVDAANKQLLETADQLSKTEKELDDANAAIDAGSGGADAGELGLDAQRMRALGTIR